MKIFLSLYYIFTYDENDKKMMMKIKKYIYTVYIYIYIFRGGICFFYFSNNIHWKKMNKTKNKNENKERKHV